MNKALADQNEKYGGLQIVGVQTNASLNDLPKKNIEFLFVILAFQYFLYE
nr:11880_t:CDS:2 [Entrophospora candida]